MEKPNVIIRPMEHKDLEKVLEIESQAFNKQSGEDFIRCINRSEVYGYFVLVENEEVIGYYGISSIAEDGELLTIAIRSDRRGRGYASLMMRSSILQAGLKGSKKIFLEVNEKNIVAQNLYKKFGFKTISRRKKYYGDDDAIIMQLDL